MHQQLRPQDPVLHILWLLITEYAKCDGGDTSGANEKDLAASGRGVDLAFVFDTSGVLAL